MATKTFIPRRFRARSYALIEMANRIIAEYAAQGYDLSLRQLFYQMVARDIIPNTQQKYDALGSLISNARLAGLVDWDSIRDRGRVTVANPHWDAPSDPTTSRRIRESALRFTSTSVGTPSLSTKRWSSDQRSAPLSSPGTPNSRLIRSQQFLAPRGRRPVASGISPAVLGARLQSHRAALACRAIRRLAAGIFRCS